MRIAYARTLAILWIAVLVSAQMFWLFPSVLGSGGPSTSFESVLNHAIGTLHFTLAMLGIATALVLTFKPKSPILWTCSLLLILGSHGCTFLAHYLSVGSLGGAMHRMFS